MVVSIGFMAAGFIMWISISASNSPITLFDWCCFAGGWSDCVRLSYENYSEILRPMMILALLTALVLVGVMAAAFFGLSVLVINVVGWLWPSKGVQKLTPSILRDKVQEPIVDICRPPEGMKRTWY
jgi:hypothetical protein